jgi:hypothetical protein
MIWCNGDKYVGEWLNDTMNGSGILIMSSGGKYEGEWANGLVCSHNSGTLKLRNSAHL